MNQVRKQAKFIAVATMLLIVVVAIFVARQSHIGNLYLLSRPRPSTPALSNPPTPISTNEFDLTTTRVGDTVVGLMVAEIKPYNAGWPLDPDNVVVRFSGTLTLQGYSYELSGAPCFEVADDESRRRVPHMRGDGRVANFCLRNGEYAHSSLEPLDTGKRVTIVIDHYTIRSYPNGDSTNQADLVKVISKEEI